PPPFTIPFPYTTLFRSGLELEGLGLARCDLRYRAPASGAVDGVQVDGVDLGARRIVRQADLHRVALADPDHRPWDRAVAGPVGVGEAIGQDPHLHRKST